MVDTRIIQRLDYPEYIIDVDRAKAADLGLTQTDVMQNVVAALNSSIQFNKKNFWIDPVSSNQYYVGVQYPEEDIQSVETLLDIPDHRARLKTSRSRCGTSSRCAAQACPRDHAHQSAADHRPDDGSLGPRPGTRRRRRRHASSPNSASRSKPAIWAPFDPGYRPTTKPMEGSRDRALAASTPACRIRSSTWAWA